MCVCSAITSESKSRSSIALRERYGVDTVVGHECGDPELHGPLPSSRYVVLKSASRKVFPVGGCTSVLFKTGRDTRAETVSMTEPAFTPAAGRFAPTRFYDPVVALTRERLWRSLAVMYVAPRPGDVIADVGCGTGSLAVLLSRVEPRARGRSDWIRTPKCLPWRGAKADAADATVDWRVSMGDALVESLGRIRWTPSCPAWCSTNAHCR